MPLDRAADPVFVHSACPHDCPSTCAPEVERLSSTRIGKVRGARGNDYTDGVVCAKVARYAERGPHPARLPTPLRRVGDRGPGRDAYPATRVEAPAHGRSGEPIKAEQRHGVETGKPQLPARP